MCGVKGVLHLDGYILDADGINRRRVDDLCTEVAELHGLDIAELVDGVGRLDDLRVGSHEAVDVGPYLEHLGIEGGSDDGSGVVRAATAQVGGLVAVAVAGYEARHDEYGLGCVIATEGAEGLLDELRGELGVEHVLALLILGAYEVAGIHAHAVLHQGGHDVRRQSLAVADDGILGLGTQVVDEVDTIVDAAQLVEELVYLIK